ncbi:gem-associated protein 4 isoform X1 [Gadus chalcogrammus]|uniref:gem-associated protein 4 isoform X1 n=1 Tax=Gadus chalcogrammus TaxID=1042646 RepID=UPI0024C4829E|nr:gem-associated protein 4 isoform X1 [Gadus chalcogrammus]
MALSLSELHVEAAILQGGFLSANKLCHPSSLRSVQKGDWKRVRQPILDAVDELCKQVECNVGLASSAIQCKTNIVTVLWCKLLCNERREDVETAWRENLFFALQSGLPEINRVVLLELVKERAAAGIYGQLLLRLPDPQICSELSLLVDHVVCSPTSEGDIGLLLDVWWELWRGGVRGEDGGMGIPEDVFANEFARLTSKPSLENGGVSHQAAKRFKLDTSFPLEPLSSLPVLRSSPPLDILYMLLQTLWDVRDCIATADLSQQALVVALDAIYTSFLLDRVVILTTEEKMHFLTKVVSLKEKEDKKWSLALLREAQLDLRTCSKPAKFRPDITTLPRALRIITELTQCWLQKGLLKVSDSADPSNSAFRLQQSLQRGLVALENGTLYQSMSGAEDQQTLKDLVTLIRGVQDEFSTSPAVHCSPEACARLTMTIIDHRLEEYLDFAALFVRETSWATSGSEWTDCLERNQAVFRKKDTVFALATMLISICSRETVDVSHCKKMSNIIANIFLELPLGDKNQALASMLRLSSRGLFGGQPPPALVLGFDQELNMAFNCIIQGGDSAGTKAGSPDNLSTATSLVARVAFQNPEATLRSCCSAAIFNKGGFTLMAKILLQLPGLRGGGITEGSLLCCCLREAIGNKALLACEQHQFVRFLALLMQPVPEDDCGVEGRHGGGFFLSPADVVKTFVLPHIFSHNGGPISVELAVQILHSALCVEVKEPPSSAHWMLLCSPFPLLYVLAQHLNQAFRCWEPPAGGTTSPLSSDTKELLVWVLGTLGQAVGRVVASEPSTWSRALSWLYSKVEDLDWTVRFHFQPVWGEHFKNEVPSSLLAVCDLAEQEWSGLELPKYGQGSGLLAWLECCCVSDSLRSTMLSHLCVDRRQPDHINMFSKGLLVALAQMLPWCSLSEWRRLLGALGELLDSGLLHTPYSLEYVDYLPLLDLRCFSSQLRLSVLLLRALQFLCGSSCDGWLPVQGWAHVGRLYAYAIRQTLEVLRTKMGLSSSSVSSADPTSGSPNPPKSKPRTQSGEVQQWKEVAPEKSSSSLHPKSTKSPAVVHSAEGIVGDLSAEVLFVLGQLFCHVQHVQVMMPGGQCEALFLCALETLSLYDSVMASYPESSSHLESANTRHFFTTITDNLESQEMKAVLHQKIAKLLSSTP